VSKSCGNIPFHKEVTVPGTTIPRKGHKEQEPPAEEKRTEQEEDTEERAHKVPPPRGWL